MTLVALAGAELAVAVVGAVAAGLTAAEVVDSYLVTNTAMGVGFAACGGIVAGSGRATRSVGCSWWPAWPS